MNQLQHRAGNEEGFVLVVALMILVILSLIGIAGLTTSTFEKQIAGNDWNAKRTFYRADGGLSQGIELVEQSFACPGGFNNGAGTQKILENHLLVLERGGNDMMLYMNDRLDTDDAIKNERGCFLNPAPFYDAAFPVDALGNLPTHDVGFLYVGGTAVPMPGGNVEMGAGSPGFARVMDIHAQYLGPKNSETIISAVWRHRIGNEGSCKY